MAPPTPPTPRAPPTPPPPSLLGYGRSWRSPWPSPSHPPPLTAWLRAQLAAQEKTIGALEEQARIAAGEVRRAVAPL